MKALSIAIAVVGVVVGAPLQSSAQQPRGFVTFGISSDVNDQHFPGIGGGAVFDLWKPWISVGAEGDVFFSNGYAAGRGGPIAQANFVRHRVFRPFVMGGYGWGEVVGGGKSNED